MTENFNLYSKYYDLLYRNKNYIEEVNYISTCIQTYAPETTTILEFGSGTGGHGLHLQETVRALLKTISPASWHVLIPFP